MVPKEDHIGPPLREKPELFIICQYVDHVKNG